VDPRRRRRRNLGAPVLGHQGRRRGARRDRPLPRCRARRRRGLLHDPHSRAGGAAGRSLWRAGPADHRLGGLPRPGAPALLQLPRLRPAWAHARARADQRRRQWRLGLERPPVRAVPLADRPLRRGQVHDRAGGRARAAREGTPGRGARRRRRAPQPDGRPRLLAQGPRHQRRAHRLRRGPALAQRRDRDRGGDLPLPRRTRPGAPADARTLRRGVRGGDRRRVRAAGREGPLQACARW
jgi:hypothetical protein